MIIISDDLPEILASCTRVLVMNHGEITGNYDTSEITEAELSQHLSKN